MGQPTKKKFGPFLIIVMALAAVGWYIIFSAIAAPRPEMEAPILTEPKIGDSFERELQKTLDNDGLVTIEAGSSEPGASIMLTGNDPNDDDYAGDIMMSAGSKMVNGKWVEGASLTLRSNGDFLANGKKITNDKQLYELVWEVFCQLNSRGANDKYEKCSFTAKKRNAKKQGTDN
jgi:hypothetical protein